MDMQKIYSAFRKVSNDILMQLREALIKRVMELFNWGAYQVRGPGDNLFYEIYMLTIVIVERKSTDYVVQMFTMNPSQMIEWAEYDESHKDSEFQGDPASVISVILADI